MAKQTLRKSSIEPCVNADEQPLQTMAQALGGGFNKNYSFFTSCGILCSPYQFQPLVAMHRQA